jgi:hypothetical protein
MLAVAFSAASMRTESFPAANMRALLAISAPYPTA